MSKKEQKMIQCCSRFRGEKFALVDKNGLYNRYLEVGICPICQKQIAVLVGRRFLDNKLVFEKKEKRKAINLYNECMSEVTYNIRNIKYGTKSNAGFYFGENRIVKVGENLVIKRYRVDFNNTKELIEENKL